MSDEQSFVHQRHKPGTPLARPRELVVACVPMRSNVNVSQIARTASAVGAERLILTGTAKLINKIARDGAEALPLSIHRTLPPVLQQTYGLPEKKSKKFWQQMAFYAPLLAL